MLNLLFYIVTGGPNYQKSCNSPSLKLFFVTLFNVKIVRGINGGFKKESISTYPTKLSKQPLSARWRAIWSTRAAIESNGGQFVDIKNSFQDMEANETRTVDRRWMPSVYFGFRLRQRADITTFVAWSLNRATNQILSVIRTNYQMLQMDGPATNHNRSPFQLHTRCPNFYARSALDFILTKWHLF